MLPLLVSNAPHIAIQSLQRRNAVVVETAWEKEKNKMTDNDNDIPALKGWFLKEKRDTFKKRQSVLPSAGTNTNRRFFTIERIPNSSGTDASLLALCYYKRSSENEERCGWLFLNDVTSLSQDVPNRWITIEHPTRIMRLQSPTPAQVGIVSLKFLAFRYLIPTLCGFMVCMVVLMQLSGHW